jgi:hypothetical protein
MFNPTGDGESIEKVAQVLQRRRRGAVAASLHQEPERWA